MILDDLLRRVNININVESNEIGLIILGGLVMIGAVGVAFYSIPAGIIVGGIGAILLGVGIYLKTKDGNSWN